MIKFNRIGNKLGLAGAVGILLARVGMVANQMMSEAEIERRQPAGRPRPARHRRHASASQVELRQIQVAARNIQPGQDG